MSIKEKQVGVDSLRFLSSFSAPSFPLCSVHSPPPAFDRPALHPSAWPSAQTGTFPQRPPLTLYPSISLSLHPSFRRSLGPLRWPRAAPGVHACSPRLTTGGRKTTSTLGFILAFTVSHTCKHNQISNNKKAFCPAPIFRGESGSLEFRRLAPEAPC